MTVILGAAGSGKTIVLVERLVAAIQTAEPTDPPCILVTMFNKGLKEHVGELIRAGLRNLEETLSEETLIDGVYRWNIDRGGVSCSITLVHRDVFHRREVFDIPPGKGIVASRDDGKAERERLVEEAVQRRGGKCPAHLEEDFLNEEFSRVVVGRRIFELEDYLTRPRARQGRGRPLGEKQRREVWSIIGKYPSTFVYQGRRWEALRRFADTLEDGSAIPDTRWTHLFVDECQDLTESDFRLFAAMVQERGGLCVAGDEAQAIHLGSTYRRPGEVRGGRWRTHDLSGSYRIPLRLAEAIRPVAEYIRSVRSTAGISGGDIAIPESRKASFIGPRLVVAQTSPETRARVIRSIVERYLPFIDGVNTPLNVCLVDPVRSLHHSQAGLSSEFMNCEIVTKTMLAGKGLEYPIVVVMDEKGNNGDIAEGLYTSLTRATHLAVLLLESDEPNSTWPVLAHLDHERLVFYDQSSALAFKRLCEKSASAVLVSTETMS